MPGSKFFLNFEYKTKIQKCRKKGFYTEKICHCIVPLKNIWISYRESTVSVPLSRSSPSALLNSTTGLYTNTRLYHGIFLFKRRSHEIFGFFMYCIQDCFICRPTDSIVSEDAGIEPRTVATTASTFKRRSNHSAKSHPLFVLSTSTVHVRT